MVNTFDPWKAPRLTWGQRLSMQGQGQGAAQPQYALATGEGAGGGQRQAYQYNGQTYYLPIAYDASKDTTRWELGGEAKESTMDRAIRWATQDGAQALKGATFDQRLLYWLANFASDWRRRDPNANVTWGELGYDPAQFANNEFGEQYDAQKRYYTGQIVAGDSGGDARITADNSGNYSGGYRPAGWTAAGQGATDTQRTAPATPAPGATPGTTPPATTPATQPATAVADGTGAGSTPPATPNNAAYNSFLASNPAARTQRLYELLGIGNPANARSVFGGHLAGLAELFDPWSLTQSLGGQQQVDDFDGLLAQFAGRLYQPGAFGQFAADATSAMNGIDWSKLDDKEVAQTLGRLQGLQTYGMNPLIGKVYGNTLDDALAMFLGQVSNTARSNPEQAAAMRFMDYLRATPGIKGILGLR